MMRRVYHEPQTSQEEFGFLSALVDKGAYLKTLGEQYELGEVVYVCFWSKLHLRSIEVGCSVVGRRLFGDDDVPQGIKVQALQNERGNVRLLLR